MASLENQSGGAAFPFHHFPQKREASHRIFVNRSLQLSKIKFFGFDMDHTLAVYKKPEIYDITFKLTIEQLLKLGYPKELSEKYSYDPTFSVRGLWYDRLFGNLLKVDMNGSIILAYHGFNPLPIDEVRRLYPNNFIYFDESRIYALNTPYDLPVCNLFSCLVDYFGKDPNYKKVDTGYLKEDVFMSFKALAKDVEYGVNMIYGTGRIQKVIMSDVGTYIEKNEILPKLLDRMRENAKVFLITNSAFDYTDSLMGYMLNEFAGQNSDWKRYFDYIIVSSGKPAFFADGTPLKEIDIKTGAKSIGIHKGVLKPNCVYSGGNGDEFSKLIGASGDDVLYVGDHIYADIMKSKKSNAWKTFLIVPELEEELAVWHKKKELFTEVQSLEEELSTMLVNLDSSSKVCPDTKILEEKIKAKTREMDLNYSQFGSAFRCGSMQTYFSSQITRYADIYAATCVNLYYYPFFYLFQAPTILMPHESTVDPTEPFSIEHNKK